MADVSRLPGPNADIWDWQLIGLCRGEDPNVFFHPEGERGPARVNRDVKAKTICGACPVKLQCAQHALAVKEPYGVWGRSHRRRARGHLCGSFGSKYCPWSRDHHCIDRFPSSGRNGFLINHSQVGARPNIRSRPYLHEVALTTH